MDFHLRASTRYGGQGVFPEFLVTDPPRDCPVRGGDTHRANELNFTILPSYLNAPI